MITGIFGVLLGILLSWLYTAWGLMLIVGIIHLDWWSEVPTMSFVTAFLLAGVRAAFRLGSLVTAANISD